MPIRKQRIKEPLINRGGQEWTVNKVMRLVKLSGIPTGWRLGQFIFNRVHDIFGSVAREVGHEVDCFYDDSKINVFLKAVVKKLNE